MAPSAPDFDVSSALKEVEVERRTKISETAALRIAQQIVTNRMPVGAALPSEKEMAASLGIGRNTMREALRILETFGMIEIRTGRYGGPVVRRPDARNLSVSLTLAFYANGNSILQVLEARLVIEPPLAALAAKRVTVYELDAMQATVDNIREHPGSEAVFLRESELFHNLVADAADSPVLSHISAGLHSIAASESAGVKYEPRQYLTIAKSHEDIIGALRARDSELAEDLWRKHLSAAVAYWTKRYPKQTTPAIEWSIGMADQR